MILALDNVAPRGKLEPGNVGRTGFDAQPMLVLIGTDDLDIYRASATRRGDVLPFAPGQLDWISRVGDDVSADQQIVARDAVAQAVALAFDADAADVAQRLLDGIDRKERGGVLNRLVVT